MLSSRVNLSTITPSIPESRSSSSLSSGMSIRGGARSGAGSRASAIDRSLEDRAMTQVHAVEITDCADRIRMARQRFEIANYLHGSVAARLFQARSPAAKFNAWFDLSRSRDLSS